jgi:hypothetical protein
MSAPKKNILPQCLLVAGVVCLGTVLFFVLSRWRYYQLPMEERIDHPCHSQLRPSGYMGLRFGIVGLLLMILNLGYLARKNVPFLSRFGALRNWMAFHVFTGLVGPALILLHSSFLLRSALGTLSFVAMWVVVVTGILGRFIYSRVPRSLEGRELELQEVRQRLQGYFQELEKLGIGASILQNSKDGISEGSSGGVLSTILGLFTSGGRMEREYLKLRKAVLSSKALRDSAHSILPLAKRIYRERQWLKRYAELRSLMGTWRFFHRWLAIVMLLVVAFHILMAVNFGDLWTLQEPHGGP